jgi:hypothetical protein
MQMNMTNIINAKSLKKPRQRSGKDKKMLKIGTITKEFFSLLTAVSDAEFWHRYEEENWENISSKILRKKEQLKRLGKVFLPSLRELPDPESIFIDLAQDPLAWLLELINNQIPPSKSAHHTEEARIKFNELWQYCGMLLSQLVSNESSERVWLDNKTRQGLPRSRFGKITSLLKYDLLVLAEKFSISFRSSVRCAGECTLDETIWEWDGDAIYVVHVPRKPNSTGIKVFTLSFKLHLSGLPYCFYMWPDLLRPGLYPSAVLEAAYDLFDPALPTAITADAWFTSLHWAHANRSRFFTLAVSHTVDRELFDYFETDLTCGRYRVFRNPDFLLSLSFDAEIMRTISTCYKIDGAMPVAPPRSAIHQAGLLPVISVEGCNKLLELSQDDLQGLAGRCGQATSMLYHFKLILSVTE